MPVAASWPSHKLQDLASALINSCFLRAAEDAELQRQHLQQQQTNGLNQVAHPQVTRRQLAAASLSALSLPSALALSYALPGQLAHAAEAEEKRKNLPLNELKVPRTSNTF